MKNIIFSLACLLFISCDFYDDRLIINNISSKNIYITVIPDTILNLGENRTFLLSDWRIGAYEKHNLIIPEKKGWEWEINGSVNKELHVFVLNEDTLNKYEPSEIVKRQLFEKRIDIGVKELEENNWVVQYK